MKLDHELAAELVKADAINVCISTIGGNQLFGPEAVVPTTTVRELKAKMNTRASMDLVCLTSGFMEKLDSDVILLYTMDLGTDCNITALNSGHIRRTVGGNHRTLSS